jgi:hypothetical protein
MERIRGYDGEYVVYPRSWIEFNPNSGPTHQKKMGGLPALENLCGIW